jgi:phosphatidylethanolamine-binding protein (PEBP) family uncharacterized protein
MLERLPEIVGQALVEVRSGLTNTLFHDVDLRQGMGAMTLASLAFGDHQPLPQQYTADGPGLSPPLHWHGVPAAVEVVLIVEDADSPTPQPLVHAIAHGLPIAEAQDGAVAQGALGAPGEEPLVPMGRNSLLQARWLPPDPPPGHGVHRYVFQIFALEPGGPLPETPGREALRDAVLARGLASACLIGTFERPSAAVPEPLAAGAPQRAAGA